MNDCLFLIPARGGSKGIPGKNTKLLKGKPLIHYSIEYARQFVADEFICLSTDSADIAACAKEIGLDIPFLRPGELATDQAGSYGVIKHAVNFYLERGKGIKRIVLLQPTSPFREKFHLEEALRVYDETVDMVTSVTESAANPYYNLFEEDNNGLLQISKGDGRISRRQDAPPVFAYNGSIYIINVQAILRSDNFSHFSRVKKYVMEEKYALDLDTKRDWDFAEFLLKDFDIK